MKTKVWIFNQHILDWKQVEGKMLKSFWSGRDFLLHRHLDYPKLWVVSEAQTTAMVKTGRKGACKTQKLAKVLALQELERRGYQALENAVERTLAYYPQLKQYHSRREHICNDLCNQGNNVITIATKEGRKEQYDIDRHINFVNKNPISIDMILDMAKIAVLTTRDFVTS